MTNVRQKLNSDRGASFVIALVFFLLCLTVGSIILTAATASIGRVDRISGEQRAYFAVRSAAELLRDEVAGSSYSATFEKHMEGTERDPSNVKAPTSVFLPVATQAELTKLRAKMDAYYSSVFEFETEQAENYNISKGTLTIKAQDAPTVMATYEMEPDYSITFSLDTEDTAYPTPMTLVFAPTADRRSGTRRVEWTEYENDLDDAGNLISIPVEKWETIRTESVHVEWAEGIVTKGAGA